MRVLKSRFSKRRGAWGPSRLDSNVVEKQHVNTTVAVSFVFTFIALSTTDVIIFYSRSIFNFYSRTVTRIRLVDPRALHTGRRRTPTKYFGVFSPRPPPRVAVNERGEFFNRFFFFNPLPRTYPPYGRLASTGDSPPTTPRPDARRPVRAESVACRRRQPRRRQRDSRERRVFLIRIGDAYRRSRTNA